jgi:hypothetical protein
MAATRGCRTDERRERRLQEAAITPSSGAFASIVPMISGERATEIEQRLAELLEVEVDQLRDYLAGNVGASPTRNTGFRFVRGTHGGQYVRDRDGTDIVRAGVSVP